MTIESLMKARRAKIAPAVVDFEDAATPAVTAAQTASETAADEAPMHEMQFDDAARPAAV